MAGVILRPLLPLRQRRHQAFAHHRVEQRFLAVEVKVDGALRHAGAGRHVIKSRHRVAFFAEEL
jgi:hypothetical protein